LPKLYARDEIRHVYKVRPRATLALLLTACSQPSERARPAARDTVVVFSASSVAVPLRAALDSFARGANAVLLHENGASLDLARRVTELGRIPDLIVLADQEVFPELLVPSATSWYVRFARNRMVIAYTDRSRAAAELSERTWRQILLRPDVLLGRSDPTLAPVGYRALLMYRLAERFYGEPGLAERLAARTPPRLMRGNASELAALLSAGELDYIVDYESLAKANGLRYLKLPPAIDLGDPALAAEYGRESVRVVQRSGAATRVGAPIMYAASVPRAAPHQDGGVRALSFLLGAEGRALLRARSVDALDAPELVGDSVPTRIRRAVTP
jgi:molybdate/tungstate transport system substrate-binding protein